MQEDSAPQHPTTSQVPTFFTVPLLRYFLRLGRSDKDVVCRYEHSSLAIKHSGYFQLRSAPDNQRPLCLSLCISLQQAFCHQHSLRLSVYGLLNYFFLNLFNQFFHLFYIPTNFPSSLSPILSFLPSILSHLCLFHFHQKGTGLPRTCTKHSTSKCKDAACPLTQRQGQGIQPWEQVNKSQLSTSEFCYHCQKPY